MGGVEKEWRRGGVGLFDWIIDICLAEICPISNLNPVT